jgi:hypothetical protein
MDARFVRQWSREAGAPELHRIEAHDIEPAPSRAQSRRFRKDTRTEANGGTRESSLFDDLMIFLLQSSQNW